VKKILLSSIGSRGDVQPMLALAIELRTLGAVPHFVVPPNFRDWVESLGFACTPIGPDVRNMTPVASPAAPPTPERRRELAAGTVHEQFRVLGEAALGCSAIVACGALQIAAQSIGEIQRIPVPFVSYAAVSIPGTAWPPPRMGVARLAAQSAAENAALWEAEERNWNELFGSALNEERAREGLAPVVSVLRHVITASPWLAADPALGPLAPAPGLEILQDGAWLLRQDAPLPAALEQFLAGREPPVYLGFGSMRGAEGAASLMIDTARSIGRRVIMSAGWGGLASEDARADCLAIGEVNHAALFPRVAAVVHHGGAGTTHTAALAGAPQVIVPHHYDQPYWARRVSELGIGVSGPERGQLAPENFEQALRGALSAGVVSRAREFAANMEPRGARRAAERLMLTLA